MSFKDEFVNINLGDERLNKLFLKIGDMFIEKPSALIKSTFGASKALAKSAYRFFSNSKVTLGNILEAHRLSVSEKANKYREVYVIQDTTTVLLNEKEGNSNLGVAASPKGHRMPGLLIHSSLCIGEDDIACGLIDQVYFDHGEADGRKKADYENRESARWEHSLRVTHAHLPNAITIADRECDIGAFLKAAQDLDARYVVRAKHDRKTVEFGEKISEILFETKPCGSTMITIEGRGDLLFDIKYKTMTFLHESEELSINVVHVAHHSQASEDKITWVLLTNLDVKNFDDALKIITIYRKRWHIESFHKSLKTGYQVEKAKLESKEGLIRMFVMLSICAARVYSLIWVARNRPELSCEPLLSKVEWQAAYVLNKMSPPKNPPTINQIILLIAMVGGYLNRKKDPLPGIKVIWRGLMRIESAAAAIDHLNKIGALNLS